MIWPGENLLIRLWESLADKGVGSLLKPWQMRREGRADIDLRRYEILALADAEHEAEEIRSGRRKLENARFVLSLTANVPVSEDQAAREDASLVEVASRAIVADTMRKEINVAKAILHAEEELRGDEAPPPEQKLDNDWLYRWRDYAGSVSSEELQAIWGKILAGELKSPGLYSYRLLEFVRNLTRDEANLIGRIAPFVITDMIVYKHDAILKEAGITFGELLQLQDLGILSGVGTFGLNKTFNSSLNERYIKALLCHNRALLIEHDDANKTLTLNVYAVTDLGRQVIMLGKFAPNEEYLVAVGRDIQKSKFKVGLIDYIDIGNGMIQYMNRVEIEDAQQADVIPGV